MHLSHLPPLLLTLPLILSTTAVDITLSLTPPNAQDIPDVLPGAANNPVQNPALPWAGGNVIAHFGITYQRCTNQIPGACCKPRPPPAHLPPAMAAMFPQLTFSRATFTGLGPLDLGVVWVPRGNVLGCYGTPKETHWGGGPWVYDLPAGDADAKLSGANWIRMPTSLPPKETDSAWLSAEGLLGLVWGRGGGTWFSNDAAGAAKAALVAAAEKQLQGSGWAMRRRKRTVNTHIRSADRGVVFCQGPAWAKWADVIAVNGTEYVVEEVGGEVYKSAGGDVLDFTGAGS